MNPIQLGLATTAATCALIPDEWPKARPAIFLAVLAGLFVWMGLSPADAMTADTASAKCATAIDGYLRDPSTADYQFTQRVVVGNADNWKVILPVRAQNAFGGLVTHQFGCLIVGGQVVKVLR